MGQELNTELRIFELLGECDRKASTIPTLESKTAGLFKITVKVPEDLLPYLSTDVFKPEQVITICDETRNRLVDFHQKYLKETGELAVRQRQYADHLPYLRELSRFHSITHGARLWQRVQIPPIVDDIKRAFGQGFGHGLEYPSILKKMKEHPENPGVKQFLAVTQIDESLIQYAEVEDYFLESMKINGLKPPLVRKMLAGINRRFFDGERCIVAKFIEPDDPDLN